MASFAESEVFWILLVIFYTSTVIISGVQSTRFVAKRNALLSFQGCFLVLSFLWSLFRLIFWSCNTSSWPFLVEQFVFYLPYSIQFAIFSALATYFVRLVHQHDWAFRQRWIFAVYLITNLMVLGATVVFVVFLNYLSKSSSDHAEQDIQEADQGFSLFLGILYLLLLLNFSLYGYKLWKLQQREQPAVPSSSTSSSAHKALFTRFLDKRLVGISASSLLTLCCVFIFIFASRCIYEFLDAGNIYSMLIYRAGSGKLQIIPWISFLSVLLWEYIPIVLILVIFRRIYDHVPMDNSDTTCGMIRRLLCCQPAAKEEVITPVTQEPEIDYSELDTVGLATASAVPAMTSSYSPPTLMPRGSSSPRNMKSNERDDRIKAAGTPNSNIDPSSLFNNSRRYDTPPVLTEVSPPFTLARNLRRSGLD